MHENNLYLTSNTRSKCASSLETQGQLVGAEKSLSGREKNLG